MAGKDGVTSPGDLSGGYWHECYRSGAVMIGYEERSFAGLATVN